MNQAELLDKLDYYRGRVTSIRAKAAEKAEDVLGSAATVTGGIVVGYLDARHYETKPLGLNLGLVGGLGMMALGFSGSAGKHSSAALSLGNGMLACEAYKESFARLQKSETAGVGARYALQPGGRPPTAAELMSQFQSMAR